MMNELFLRTGLGANRAGTAKLRAIRALSTEISAGFSTVASENWFVTGFLEVFRRGEDLPPPGPGDPRSFYPRAGGSKQRRQRASYTPCAPTTTSSSLSTRRWVLLAGEPQRTQIASVFVTSSATAIKEGIGPKGSPRKSLSRPATRTRLPWSANC